MNEKKKKKKEKKQTSKDIPGREYKREDMYISGLYECVWYPCSYSLITNSPVVSSFSTLCCQRVRRLSHPEANWPIWLEGKLKKVCGNNETMSVLITRDGRAPASPGHVANDDQDTNKHTFFCRRWPAWDRKVYSTVVAIYYVLIEKNTMETILTRGLCNSSHPIKTTLVGRENAILILVQRRRKKKKKHRYPSLKMHARGDGNAKWNRRERWRGQRRNKSRRQPQRRPHLGNLGVVQM